MSWKPRAGTLPGAVQGAIPLALLAGAAFSFFQLGSPTFACGRDLAGSAIHAWLAFSALQGLLFVAAAFSDRARTAYRLLQYATLPVVAFVVAQLALAYPRTALAAMLFAGLYQGLVRLPELVPLPARLRGRGARPPATLGGGIAETAIFLVALLVVHSSIAFALLHVPALRLGDAAFAAIALGSSLICAWLVRREAPSGPVSIGDVPPLALLALVLMRAKFPDAAYDALLYKSTLPLQIAEWRTALTGWFDHTLLGTDFLEIAGAQLRILDPAYPPAAITTFAFLALWAIAPVAMRGLPQARSDAARALALRGAALLAVSITEPLTAAGTSYHEPMMSLLMAGFFLPMSAAWVFLGAAVASKATVAFAVPALVLLRALALKTGEQPWREAVVAHVRKAPVPLALSLLLAAGVVGEQLARNFAFTGRLLGVSETLAGLTDPRSTALAPLVVEITEPVPERGLHERVGKTLLHVLTLDRVLATTEYDFHVLPSSRLAAVAIAAFLCLLAAPRLRRPRERLALFGLWACSAVAMLSTFEQGRYFAPLSFSAALLLGWAAGTALDDEPDEARRRRLAVLYAIAIAAAAFGDQVAGTYANNGWDCRRSIGAGVTAEDLERPRSDLERRLAAIVADYRGRAVAGRPPPTIVCEQATERKHYLGVHHVYAYLSTDLGPRFVGANSARAALVPTSVLAVCFKDPKFADRMLPLGVRAQFAEVEGADGVRILVSKPLMAGARATSLPGSRLAPQ